MKRDLQVKLLDFRQAKASVPFVPNPPVLESKGWDNIYLELHQQPEFETIEHQHTMHVIAYKENIYCSTVNSVRKKLQLAWVFAIAVILPNTSNVLRD